MVISIGHMHFKVIENYREAFDQEQFAGKYSEVLNKYDYIVGDIGYEKLRMSGFYRDDKPKIEREKKFSAIEDYISEYCNFGCAYFILEKLSKDEVKQMKEDGVLFIELEIGGTPTETDEEEAAIEDSETEKKAEPKRAVDKRETRRKPQEKEEPPKRERRRSRRRKPKPKADGNREPRVEAKKETNEKNNKRTLSSFQND